MHRPPRHDEPVVRTPAASVARAALQRVLAERFEAHAAGVGAGPYTERLERAIAGARKRYAVSAVTEIASLRAEMGGVLAG